MTLNNYTKKGGSMRLSLILSVLLLLTCTPVFAATAGFTVDQSMVFTGTSVDPSTFYQDGVGGAFGNPDIGIQLCDAGQRYVGAFYAVNVSGSFASTLVTYSSSTNALALTSNDDGGGCFSVSPGFLTVSPSYLTTPSPFVYRAALPGRLFIGYGLSANPGSVSDYVWSNGDATLQGSYSVSRSFDQGTRDIAVSTPQITFTSTSGSFSKSATDGNFGVSDERRMALGICNDNYGGNCDSGGILSTATFPQTLASGLVPAQVNDQNTWDKYVVINGLGNIMCIGANLQNTLSGVSPDPVYYGQTLSYTVTFRNPRDTPFELNGGNVDVTTPFNVFVRIYEQANVSNVVETQTLNSVGTLSPDGTFAVPLTWPAFATSGTYVIETTIDSGGVIAECNEGDNVATTTFELLPVTLPEIYIDDVNTTTFERPNVPYRVDVHIANSDGDILRNANVSITEENGLTLGAPVQRYNRTTGPNSSVQDAIRARTELYFTTDYDGNASFTFIPTHNQLYNPEYASLGLANYAGNYSLRLTGVEDNGDPFRFVTDGVLFDYFGLNVTGLDYNGTYPNKAIYREGVTAQIMDFAYRVYVNFLDTIVS